MGAKERKTDTVMTITASDEKVVQLLAKISIQLETANGFLRQIGAHLSVNERSIPTTNQTSQEKSDISVKVDEKQSARDEIPRIEASVIMGFGDDV